ncbi:Sec-independent protein translocase protein TatB [Vibrio scophthalmi]|uniref:Sec-independent protein translocase protein TatB n=1 Tax=Vibrio scophthalmi TaxID=45658 RepID=UPI002283C474|nr:Sec-independent protein translocase protein TatB [Vibrio scophthalmi]MCY9804574.1 Sec-independent protein translocase protein TatB [Vibrio scophthalmi]
MFESSLSELLLAAVVGLIVVGPKRLPTLLRDLFRVVRIVKRRLSEVQQKLNQEIEVAALLGDAKQSQQENRKNAEILPDDIQQFLRNKQRSKPEV